MTQPSSLLIDYFSAFFGGVLVSFSPCVYPLIPVTLSFIGAKEAQAEASGLKGLFFSLIYVLGLAVTYSVLGLIASLTGRLFGQISTHPVSFLIVGNACIIAGLAFLEVFHIHFTKIALQNKVKRKGGYLAAFLFGLTSGLVVGPCTAPALGTALVYVASKQNVLYGASLLFVFAYGVGFLLILVGTFSSFVLSLPKPGHWLVRMKKMCGYSLIVIGEYFLIKAGRLM